jgi:tRNA (guanine37-N1)-methyltransferase
MKSRGYDILGNIAIVKFDRKAKAVEKKKYALDFFREHKNVSTVLEKCGKFSGRLRTLKTKYIAGIKTKEALFRENNCFFRFNVDTCYFSPRLGNERLEIARMIKNGENVLVLFAGVAPFSIVIAKHSKAKKVVSIELGRECKRYALENVKRNKTENVEIIQGDVKRVLPKMNEKFDRIVMARPNLKDSFLDITFPLIKKNGIIYYYGFYFEAEKNKMIDMICEEAKNAGKKIKILKVKKAGDIGQRKYRYRADIKVLN